jgi:hypothetical protein
MQRQFQIKVSGYFSLKAGPSWIKWRAPTSNRYTSSDLLIHIDLALLLQRHNQADE